MDRWGTEVAYKRTIQTILGWLQTRTSIHRQLRPYSLKQAYEEETSYFELKYRHQQTIQTLDSKAFAKNCTRLPIWRILIICRRKIAVLDCHIYKRFIRDDHDHLLNKDCKYQTGYRYFEEEGDYKNIWWYMHPIKKGIQDHYCGWASNIQVSVNTMLCW